MRISYPLLRRFGLGAHLALIFGLAAIPMGFLTAEFIRSQHEEAIAEAEKWTRTAARYAAAEHRAEIANTEALLTATAQQIGSQGPNNDQCVESVGSQHTLWLISSRELTCEASDGLPITDVSKLSIVQNTPHEGFSVIGPLEATGGNLRLFGVFALRADDGRMWRLVRSVDLSWTPVIGDDSSEFANFVVMEYDDNGRIFHRNAQVGSDVTEVELPIFAAGKSMGRLSGPGDSASMTVADIDGIERIFGIAPIPEAGASVVVGLARNEIINAARRDLIGSLALFGAAMALSALLAWLVIEHKILRAIRNLRDAAVATANGEDGRTVEVADGPYELRELAVAFNEMTAKLQHQALHDQLTGLPNRRMVMQRLEQMQRKSMPFSVLVVDLDGFKPVNDTYGHVVGDMVLSEVAKRLEASLPSDVTIGRVGGDEFLALIPIDTSDEEPNSRAIVMTQILLDQIRQPIKIDAGDLIKVGGCIGIASWPQGEATPEDVVRQADTELYRAKETGRNRYSVHDPKSGATRAA